VDQLEHVSPALGRLAVLAERGLGDVRATADDRALDIESEQQRRAVVRAPAPRDVRGQETDRLVDRGRSHPGVLELERWRLFDAEEA